MAGGDGIVCIDGTVTPPHSEGTITPPQTPSALPFEFGMKQEERMRNGGVSAESHDFFSAQPRMGDGYSFCLKWVL